MPTANIIFVLSAKYFILVVNIIYFNYFCWIHTSPCSLCRRRCFWFYFTFYTNIDILIAFIKSTRAPKKPSNQNNIITTAKKKNTNQWLINPAQKNQPSPKLPLYFFFALARKKTTAKTILEFEPVCSTQWSDEKKIESNVPKEKRLFRITWRSFY